MANSNSNRVQVERHGWLLWTGAVVVIVCCAVTIYFMYLRLSGQLTEGLSEAVIEGAYYVGIGLLGSIALFVAYTTLKQRQLGILRQTLSEEQTELESMRARLSEVSILFEVATSLNLPLPLESILNIMVRRVVAALKAQQASVMLYNPQTQMLETRAFYGVEGEYASRGRQKMGEGIAGQVAASQIPIILGERQEGKLGQYYKPHRNITSAISVPLPVAAGQVGVLNVNRINHPRPFSEHQRDLLKIFAEHVGSVIHRAETIETLGQKAHGLELDNHRLAEINRMKDTFLSTASHELKTPLTSIIGYAELLDDHMTMDPEQRGDFIHRLQGEAARLLKLIEDILDLTRLETGKIELNPSLAAFNEVASSATETARPLAAKKRIRLEENYDAAIERTHLDEVKLRQAVTNLLGNAIKFSPEGSTVRVSTRLIRDTFRVEVHDEGPGVNESDAEHIFDLFGQGSSSQEGLGIGLHLVKRIVELHSGTVGVDPRGGGGSIFWLELPRSGVNALPREEAA